MSTHVIDFSGRVKSRGPVFPSRVVFGILLLMSKRDDHGASKSGLAVPRRMVLRGGLAGLATAMMSRALGGCGDPIPRADAGTDAGSAPDAASLPDAGPVVFPTRDVPPAPALRSLIADIGPLGDPDANGVRVAEGFSARVLARAGENVEGTDYEWHTFPDGGATFATEDGGWIYVSNSEIPGVGGVGAIRFDASGAIVGAHRILQRTNVNCSGGRTPWHTWISCEEIPKGHAYECDPWGDVEAVVRPALGVFKHEAATIDAVNGHVYLSEDESEGCFYRFVPDRMTAMGYPDLTSGRLEVASVADDGQVTWLALPDPQYEGETPTRMQLADASHFGGGEGIWWHEGVVYLSTKRDTRIWAYDVAASRISVLYDGEALAEPPLRGVDAITVSCCGDVLVAEDGGSMQIVAILPSGETRALVQVIGQDSSEITGPAFDPSGTRLYFSSQRGDGAGITYEITGPFHEPAE